MLIALPLFVSSITVVLFALVAGLTFSRQRRTRLRLPQPDDVEGRIAALTLKVRHPWKSRLARWTR